MGGNLYNWDKLPANLPLEIRGPAPEEGILGRNSRGTGPLLDDSKESRLCAASGKSFSEQTSRRIHFWRSLSRILFPQDLLCFYELLGISDCSPEFMPIEDHHA